MVIENSFTASSVPSLLPALSKPIKTIFHRGRMRFASQFERTHEISIFQRLPGRAGQKLDYRALGLGNLYREISCAKLGENTLAEDIKCSRRHSTVDGLSFPCSPASKAQSVLSRSDVLRGVRHQPAGLFQRFLRCGAELPRGEPLPLTSPSQGSSEPRFYLGNRI